MALTPQQLQQLQADIAADPVLSQVPHTSDGALEVADAYNAQASPVFWVWKTSLLEQDVYETTSPDNPTWSWATYKAQTVQDRDSWARMFNPGLVNPSLRQTRDGWTAIFGGQGASLQQVNFLLALARRPARRIEALLYVPTLGTGTPASPANMGYEGTISGSDVEQAWVS